MEGLNLSDTLFRLLYDRAYREKFVAEGEFSDFATIDRKELNRFGEAIERNTFTGPLLAGKSLEECFPQTMKILEEADPEFRRDFLLSEFFDSYSDLNHSGKFLSLEEAFYKFAVGAVTSLQAVALHEFLTAHLQILAVHANPAFRLNADLTQPLRNGYISIQRLGNQITLYACVTNKFISGPIDESVAEVLKKYFVRPAAEIRPEHKDLVEGLRELGFVPLSKT